MHIEFRKVELHNFLSFGQAELIFADDGFIRVTGVNENPDDNATSNGSGKSSLNESIIWALTGETLRGTKQVSNIYGEDGTYVALDFNIDKTNYRIIRSKGHKVYKTSLQIFIDGKDCSGKGIRDSESLLAQYLPDITASLLGSVIILGQGLPQKFTNNSPSGRKEVLEKLSKSDFMIEDLKTRVLSRKNDLTSIIRTYQDAIIGINSKRTVLEAQITSAKHSLNTIDKSSLEEELNKYEIELNALNSQYDTIVGAIELVNKDILTLTDQLNIKSSAYMQKVQEVDTYYQPLLKNYSTEIAQLTADINAQQKQIISIQNIKDTCPTCGQKLQGVERPDPTPFITARDELKVKLNSTQALYNELNSEYINTKSSLKSQFDIDSKELNDKLSELKREYTNQGFQRDSYDRSRHQCQLRKSETMAKLASLDTTIENLHTTIFNNETELVSLNENLMYNNTNKDIQQHHLDIINKFDTALKRDFRGYLLSTIIEYISLRAKEYCKVIFETDKITFGLDGNNIEIAYLDKAYENLSGGEKQKIDLIIQFSIRDMLCNHLGFTSNILILDEVFDGLDMIGCQKVLDVISAMNDVKNIFIITHRKDLSIPTDREIVVVKSSNGISELR